MENLSSTQKSSPLSPKIPEKKINQTSYRGFFSIDQEMEREIALKFFTSSKKTICSQKGFLFA